MEPLRSILVIQTAFIGDVILATSVVETLHKKFPAAQIDFLLRKGNESLLENHPYLREVIVFDKSKKLKNLLALIGRIRKARYDVVVNIQRFATSGIMTALSGARTTIGFDKNPMASFFTKKVPHSVEGPHEVERKHQLIASLVGLHPARPRLYPTNANSARVSGFKENPYVTISPASVWFTKQFPAEKWIEFIKVLPPDIHIYLLGGGGDQAAGDELISGSNRQNIINLSGQLSFLESASLMEGALMNYANDSAPMHMASAVNAPVTAIYCSTIPGFGFGPLSDNSFVVETIEKLDCRPCGLHGLKECPLGHFDCAMTIQKEQLVATVIRNEPSV